RDGRPHPKPARRVERVGGAKTSVGSLLKPPPQGLGIDLATVPDLLRLREAIPLVKRTGVAPATLFEWAQAEPDHKSAAAAVEAVKSRYDRGAWLEVARGLNDPLREKQRAALVDFLVSRMAWPHPLLKKGSPLKGPVTELQRKLNVALAPLQPVMPAVLPLKANGVFDTTTESAVKAFQNDRKIVVDGIVGPVTWSVLDRAVGAGFDRNSLLE